MSQPQQQRDLSEASALRLLNMVVATTSCSPELAAGPSGSGPTASRTALDRMLPPITPQESNEVVATTSCSPDMAAGPSGSGPTASASRTALDRMLPPITRHTSQETIHSANEYGNSCRICRWNRSDMEIIKCPCTCKGSVGFIHMKCLKRWIMHKQSNRCEICNAVFDISEERTSVKQMVRTFCCHRCCGLIVKHLLFSGSLMPLANIILQQVLHCMDNLNQGNAEQLTVREVIVASGTLLTSSVLFFNFFEFVTTRALLIRNILRHWWMFGSTSDFALVEVEDDAIDLF